MLTLVQSSLNMRGKVSEIMLKYSSWQAFNYKQWKTGPWTKIPMPAYSKL